VRQIFNADAGAKAVKNLDEDQQQPRKHITQEPSSIKKVTEPVALSEEDARDLRDALNARAGAEHDRYYSWEQVKQGF
jgi:hypothetical protein